MKENIIKVVHCKTKDIFNQRFAEINVSPEEKDENPYYYYVIVIQDTGEVYTHGKIINSDTLNKLKTLIGNDSDKSARKIAEEEISKVIGNAPEMYDTLQEIAAWIEEHGDEVTEINNGITTNAQNISTIFKHIAWNATDIIPNYKYYITKSEFITEYPNYQNENSIVYNDIVYIHDVKEIYTHGRFYNEYATFDYTEFEDGSDVYVSEYIRQTLTIASIINNHGIIPVQIKNGESFLGIGVATIYIDTKSTVKNILCETVWLDNWTDSENQKHVIFKAEYNEDSEVRYELIQKDYVFANHKTSHLIAQELTVNDQKLQLDGSIDTYVKGNGTLGKINEFLARDGVAKFANDLTGRNEATAEEFTFRPSAGNISIRDDSATIKRIKGNSVVWNQMCDFTNGVFTFGGSSGIKDTEGYTITTNESSTSATIFQFSSPMPFYSHKWLAIATIKSPIQVNIKGMPTQGFVPNTKCDIYSFYQESREDNWYWGLSIESVGTISEIKVYNYLLFDLTQIFGAGNEPDTVEEFRALFPDNYYEYNPGQLVSMTANGLFTNGFNQWDEQWESGVYSYWTDGQKVDHSEYIRSANFIRVIPAKTYCLNIAPGVDTPVCFYDENNNFLGQASYSYSNNSRLFQVPANCQKITFYTKATTYNNDICINLSHTGVENGKYEPYWDATKDLSIIQKYFPNGMRSAGSIYDEISFDETTQKWVAIQRVGNVDLGSLSWSYSEHLFGGETVAGFKTSIGDVIFANAAATLPNITVSKYNINTADKVANGYATTDTFTGYKAYKTDLYAYFTFTTDASEFKSSLSGVMLNYELAEPIITVIEEPINLSYKVGDFGIEQILSDSFSAPFRADIIYQFNATDRIRENSLNIEKLSKTQLLLAGGTMSGQINSQDIKPVEDSTYQLGDSTHKYKNVFSDFFTGNLEGNAKTATDLTGRIEATPEVFTYRPSAGEKSIKDDNAFIRRVKGNSVVFNQILVPRNSTETSNGITVTHDGTGKVVVKGTATSTTGVAVGTAQIITGHKYVYFGLIGGGANKFYWSDQTASVDTGKGCIAQPTYATGNRYFVLNVLQGITVDFTFYPQVCDLTAMFGAGNEPNSIEEFRALYPDSYYPYNAGELRNLDCSGIKTVGFNQWDEQWEKGSINQDGGNTPSTTMFRSVGYMQILQQKYCVKKKEGQILGLRFYDENKVHISGGNRGVAETITTLIPPPNAAYMRFVCTTSNTYNNDICINLHHTGWRDGDYEPYKEVTHSLPLSQITNGEPLRKAGSVYDEINETHYIKRVGVVDLGELEWIKDDRPSSTITWRFKTGIINNANQSGAILNILSSKYTTDISPIGKENVDNTIIIYNGRIYIEDTSYTDVTTFKQALSGVMLNYELAEPIVTPIETPIDFNYYVEDFGTEEALLAEDSAPFNADIIYQFNATDRIRENSLNIEKLSKTQNECLLLAGGTMSGQINSQDIKPVEDSTYQLGDSTHKYKNVFSDFFTGNLEGNAKTATDLTGRIEATPEVFTYHPSAGEKSIKDDNAFIRRVKGNSVVWNQLVNGSTYSNTQTRYGLQCSVTSNSREIRVVGTYVGDTSVADRNFYTAGALTSYSTGIVGHKYLCHISGNKKCSLSVYGWCSGSTDIFDSIIKECTSAQQLTMAIKLPLVADGTQIDETIIIDIHDLTAMFGAGNEPDTVEEFRALYPDSYYPYNTGELRNLVCSGIKTVGFNQWDEQWELGTLNGVGENDNTKTTIRSKNYTPAIGGTDYYVGITSEGYDNIYYLGISWYDSNKQFISKSYCNQRVVTSPINAAYFRIFTNTNSYVYGNTYNNNICINLHHTGYRDGEYEPYKEVTHSLPLSQITNGEPLRYVYNSYAGEQYDEINETEYIKRIGVVDLGTLDWSWDEANSVFKTYGLVGNGNAYRFFCSKYTTANYSFSDMADKTIRSTRENSAVLGIKDSSFGTDASEFKASLAGVMLNYELAEPIVTPIETPLNLDYQVEDFGTEEALLTDNSAPFSADIVYQFNATDQIRNNTRNINKLQKSAFIPSGTSAQYIRGDGSYGNVLEFTQAIPINNGEYEMPDAIHQFILTPNYYAKSPVELDNTTTVTVYVTPPEDSNYLAEYWFEFKTGEVLPDITFISSTEDTKFRIAGDMLGDAVNILHLISSDGGMTFFGEMKHYIL